MSNDVMAQYGFVLCSNYDEYRTHFWCTCKSFQKWKEFNISGNSSPELSYQKPISIAPDNRPWAESAWEMVPEEQTNLSPNNLEWQFFSDRFNKWFKFSNMLGASAKEQIRTVGINAFARLKPAPPAPPTPSTDWQLFSARKPEAKDFPIEAILNNGGKRIFELYQVADAWDKSWVAWRSLDKPEPMLSQAELAWEKTVNHYARGFNATPVYKRAFLAGYNAAKEAQWRSF